ncbi:MAG: TlpA disulfide reductase family protein [Myxococcota bacterium]
MKVWAPRILALFLAAGCTGQSSSGESTPKTKTEATPPDVAPKPVIKPPEVVAEHSVPRAWQGRWRFELDSPGGKLPFFVELEAKRGALVDAHERLPFSSVTAWAQSLRLEIDNYDSTLELRPDEARPGALSGTWRRRSPGKDSYTEMSMSAVKSAEGLRFSDTEAPLQPLDGRWRLTFAESDGSNYTGVATLRTVKTLSQSTIEGTITTDTGDYRFLEGVVAGDQLMLSVFDGAHAFLFRATVEDGALRDGHFWSRDTYHATFLGDPVEGEGAAGLADPYEIVSMTADDRRFRFDFPMLGGGRLNNDDDRFAGKVVVAEIFGTWCPNCNDQAPLMSQWYAKYREQGLEMVGIAYEFTGDEADDMEMLRRYAKRYDVKYPLVLGGTSGKKGASESLPDLSKVAAYPTTLFIGRDGTVRKIYSGFSGPATGAAYDELKRDHEALMEQLLAEAAP